MTMLPAQIKEENSQNKTDQHLFHKSQMHQNQTVYFQY